jgi:hypothetical protein
LIETSALGIGWIPGNTVGVMRCIHCAQITSTLKVMVSLLHGAIPPRIAVKDWRMIQDHGGPSALGNDV